MVPGSRQVTPTFRVPNATGTYLDRQRLVARKGDVRSLSNTPTRRRMFGEAAGRLVVFSYIRFVEFDQEERI